MAAQATSFTPTDPVYQYYDTPGVSTTSMDHSMMSSLPTGMV